MPLFEVLIPAAKAGGMDTTSKVRADSWMQALRSGLGKIGDSVDIKNVMCDVKPTGIVVTEPDSGRVFRIKELQGVGAPPPSAAPPPAAAPAPAADAGPSAASIGKGLARSGQRFAAAGGEESVSQSAANADHAGMGRGKQAPTRPIEEILGDLFVESEAIYERQNLQDASAFVLDLATKSIPCDSAAVFVADINTNDLCFAAASGPKAKEVVKFRVPMGEGIVGFAAQEGVSLAVSDVSQDDRFHRQIADKVGYETNSLLCSPVQSDGRVFGAIELVNRLSGSSFTNDEINVLNYLAHQFCQYLVNTGQTGS